MIVIKTVLKSGGEYKPAHVVRMREMIKKYVCCEYDFICYSDIRFKLDGKIRPLFHDWPGYWAKMEIFREVEESFYIDLDMTILGDITDIVMHDSSFTALSNMNDRIKGIGSALMKWKGNQRFIYDTFVSDAEKFIGGYKQVGTPYLGDQGFLWHFLGDNHFQRFQTLFPGRIRKYSDPGRADIRVYYGKKRPW